MPNTNFDLKFYSYMLPDNLIKDKYNIHIYYKNMDIEWVLEDFSLKEIQFLSEQILKINKKIKYNSIHKIFICDNLLSYKTIENILLEYYFENQKKYSLPNNLLMQSTNNFFSNNYE